MPARASLLQRLLGRSPGEPLLVQVREGGASFRRVVFTRNRRVMVSVGDGGETLRVHEHFRTAPPEVARALGRLFAARHAAERERAREEVRRFLQALPARERRRAPRRVPAADRAQVARLQAEFDRVNANFFAGSLPRVPIALSGRMRRRNGHFSPDPLEIVISRRLCTDAVDGEAERTLRHEMIHLWQHAQGKRPDHGAEFRRWARRLDIHPRATRAVEWRDA